MLQIHIENPRLFMCIHLRVRFGPVAALLLLAFYRVETCGGVSWTCMINFAPNLLRTEGSTEVQFRSRRGCTSGGVYIISHYTLYLLTCQVSFRGRLMSLLLCLCDVFRVLTPLCVDLGQDGLYIYIYIHARKTS